MQLSLLPEEDPSHMYYELCLADAYNRCGRYHEAARQYRQLLDRPGEEGSDEAPALPETRLELLCRLADIQVQRAHGGRPKLLGGLVEQQGLCALPRIARQPHPTPALGPAPPLASQLQHPHCC